MASNSTSESRKKTTRNVLILSGVVLAAAVAGVVIYRKWDAITELFTKKADLYSAKWFEDVSDDALQVERENVRLAYSSSGDNWVDAIHLEKLLYRIDAEISKRAWGGKKPEPPHIHRENGWYLPNDD